jgi:hypothetical protein
MAILADILGWVVDFLLWEKGQPRPTTPADAARGIVVLAIIATPIVGFVWWRNR